MRRLNNTNNQWVKEKKNEKSKKYLETNENANISEFVGFTKAFLRGKFTVIKISTLRNKSLK